MDEKDQMKSIEDAANALELQAQAELKSKKPKTGLIVGISAVAILALGGGGLGVAYAISHNPENTALSAFSSIANFLSGTEAKSVNGKIEFSVKSDSSSTDYYTNKCADPYYYKTNCAPYKNPLEKVEIELVTNTDSSKQNATTAVLKVTYDGEKYEVSLGSVVIKDYTLYLSVDGVKDTASKLMKGRLGDYYEDYGSLYEDLVNTIAGEIDGQWFKVSVPELVDGIDEIDSSDKSKIKEAYTCVTNAITKAQEKSNTYIDLYKKNAFLTLSEYKGNKTFSGSGKAYTISIDANKYTNFANAMTDEIDSLGINKCLESIEDISGVSTSYEVEKVTLDEVEKTIEKLPDMIITLNNNFFGSDLTGFYLEREDTTYSGKIEFTFGKTTGEVKAPSDAKSAADLYQDILNKVVEWQETAECRYIKENYPTYYNTYCDANYHVLTTSNSSSMNRLLNV